MTSEKPIVIREIVHHQYIPMRSNWWKDRGNFFMVQWNTEVSDEEIASAFTTPSGASTIDNALVEHFKTLGRGKAVKFPKDSTITERSLKVRVGKAAALANRKIDWAKTPDGGFLARVIEILQPANGTNGTVAATEVPSPTVETPTEEAASSRGRNR